MEDKKKIKIIADNLRKYLEDWKNKVTHLNSFYYLSLANLRVYEDFLNNLTLDTEEQNLINEALKFDNIKFGIYEYNFKK